MQKGSGLVLVSRAAAWISAPCSISPNEEPFESATVEKIYRDHRVFARHGDIFDPTNYENSRDASSLGDAIVVELLDKFGVTVRNRLGSKLPNACEKGLKKIDNVRPLSIIPIWVDGLLLNTCTPESAEEIKGIWNELVHEFLRLDFVNSRRSGSALKLKLGFELSSELPMSGLSDIAAWFSSKFENGHGESFYPHTLSERAFLEGWAAEKRFVGYHVMTYLTFFRGDERKGRSFESWTGALDSS